MKVYKQINILYRWLNDRIPRKLESCLSIINLSKLYDFFLNFVQLECEVRSFTIALFTLYYVQYTPVRHPSGMVCSLCSDHVAAVMANIKFLTKLVSDGDRGICYYFRFRYNIFMCYIPLTLLYFITIII